MRKKEISITVGSILILLTIPLTVSAGLWVRGFTGEAKSTKPPNTIFSEESATNEFISNEILIKLKKNSTTKVKKNPKPNSTGLASLNKLNKKNKVRTIQRLGISKKVKGSNLERWVKITTSDKKEILTGDMTDILKKSGSLTKLGELLDEYKKDPNVQSVTPSTLVKPADISPNDYYFSTNDLWHTPSHSDLWNIQKINLPSAWEDTTGSENVVVAVIDTGIDNTHPDLKQNIWQNTGEIANNGVDDDGNGFKDDIQGWNFINDNNDLSDINGHGTHVAGIIGAVGNNDTNHLEDTGTRLVGTNWKISLMPVKFITSRGGSDFDAASAINYAVDNGASIINASWGGVFPSPIVSEAINYAHSKGVIFVAAAGNYNQTASTYSPANEPNVIAVSSTNYQDEKSCFSNFGIVVDVAAPGGDATRCGGVDDGILSARSSTTNREGVGEYYLLASGTSMAAPHVAGIAALIKAKNPDFTNEEIRHILRNSADPIFGTNWNENVGYGRVNAAQALSSSSPPPTPRITTLPATTNPQIISIKGYVHSKNPLSNYKLEYGKGKNPSEWNQLASGTSAVPNETQLASLDGRNLSGYFTFRLSATDSDGQKSEDRIQIYFENNLVSSLPKSIEKPAIFLINYFLRGDEASLAFGDITGNGKPELVATSLCKIYAWKGNGNITPGFPAEISDSSCEAIRHVTLVDLDKSGNGAQEILVTGASKMIYVLNGDGTTRKEWPKNLAEIDPHASESGLSGLFPFSYGLAADLDSDNQNEIITHGFQIGGIGNPDPAFAFEEDGSLMTGWPSFNHKTFYPNFMGSGSFGNYLPGQEKEVIIPTLFDGAIFNSSGDTDVLKRFVPGGASEMHQFSFPSANFDLDSLDEVISVLRKQSDQVVVEALNVEDATNSLGWSKEATSSWGGASIADVDGNGELEILFNADDKIYIWKKDGSDLPGWPKEKNKIARNQYPPTTLDLNRDGKLEIIVADAAGEGLSIFDYSGKKIFSAPYLGNIYTHPIAADFDGDGIMEIAVLASSDLDILKDLNIKLYLFEIPDSTVLPHSTPWPQMNHDSGRSSLFSTCQGDLNSDGLVNYTDYTLLTQKYGKQTGQTGFFPEYDMNSNGTIDAFDLFQFSSHFGACAKKEKDTDNDKFSDRLESYTESDPSNSCSTNTSHTAWPPDLNNDKAVSGLDIFTIIGEFGNKSGDENYSPRFDLNADLIIDIDDIYTVVDLFGQTCQ